MTTPHTARRGAAVAVGVVVALVVGSVLWGAGATSSDPDEPGDASAGTEEPTSTTRPRRAPPPGANVAPIPDEPVELAEPVPGFDGQVLVVADTQRGQVWQLALGGGALERLGGAAQHQFPMHLVGDHLVSHDGGISLRDGSTWQATRHGEAGAGLMSGRWAWVVGVTGTGSIVTYDEESFAVLTPAGEVVSEHPTPVSLPLGSYPRTVAGNVVVFEGAHGLVTFDLATGELRRLVVGALLASFGQHAVIDLCTDDMRCGLHVVDLARGAEPIPLAAPAPLHHSSGFPWTPPNVSPDGERLAVFSGTTLSLLDLGSGRVVGGIEVPTDERALGNGSQFVNVLWSPDGARALVIVSMAGPRGAAAVPFAAVIDRDGNEVQRREDLAAVLAPVFSEGGMSAFFLAGEVFEPWAG